jgi:hypothetical protein
MMLPLKARLSESGRAAFRKIAADRSASPASVCKYVNLSGHIRPAILKSKPPLITGLKRNRNGCAKRITAVTP